MQLNDLVDVLPSVLARIGGDSHVDGIAADSRQVEPGDLFVAIPGVNVDGHQFIAQAVDEGAVAIVGEHAPQDLPGVPWGSFAYVRVPDARAAWGWLCAAWHGFPSRQLVLIGVTGTDGKTTTAKLAHSVLSAAGIEAGMINTVAARIGDSEIDTGLHTTTPDPPQVQALLAQMVEAGARHAVLEVTSHGLAQQRVAGCDFDIAVVTNVTQEHLDFHGTLEAYQQAKAQLFKGLASSFRKPHVPKVAILNKEDDSYRYLSPLPADRQITYSLQGDANVAARDVVAGVQSSRFALHLPQDRVDVQIHLPGAYNVRNALAAASVGVALGIGPAAIGRGLSAVKGVPGRMERIDEGQDFAAIVDFAHTPNALEEALKTARAMTSDGGRVVVVFGCAGLRDPAKRGLMGRVAGRLADLVVVTAEDPRTERLEAILGEIVTAVEAEGKREGRDLWSVPDRGEALLLACRKARSGDVVIACGKGHEQSMCFGKTEYPWDDRGAMRQALRGRAMSTLPTARAGFG
jgi:UDP-N-acetylmuramoyl-L-alanyl-D-glutamate--2,6-diaminopimelate ligase